MQFSFDRKVAIVTGGGSGIGQATAWALAEEGAIVIAADRNVAGLEATASAPQAARRITAYPCDITSEEQVVALVATAEAAGGLSFAINAAGVDQVPVSFELSTAEIYERTMRVNSYGIWLCMRHQLPPMLARGNGAIVNVASVSGISGAAAMQCYSASKHAVIGFTRSAALDSIRRGVRVNAVCPGVVRTPMNTYEGSPHIAATEELMKTLPIGRMAVPRELAEPILFLLSDKASYIAGESLVVDGGWTVSLT